jgi:hypothetical protein
MEVFPLSGPEGHFTDRDGIAQVLDFPVRGVYAVYKVPDDAYQAEYWPAGQYGILFIIADSSSPYSIGLMIADGMIVRLDYYFGDWLVESFEARAGEMVLPPLGD